MGSTIGGVGDAVLPAGDYASVLKSWAYSAVTDPGSQVTAMLFGRASALADGCGRGFVSDATAAMSLARRHVAEWEELLR